MSGSDSGRARFSRRHLLRLVGGASLALAAACAAPSPSAQPTAAPANQAPATAPTQPPQPRTGGTLRVGVLGDLQGLDGHLTTGLDSLQRVFNHAVLLDDNLNVQGELMDSFQLSPDAKQLTMSLRKGVKFQSGQEVTSQDVVWNYTRLKDPKVNPIYANLTKPFAQMETPDPSTIRITFDAPNPFIGDALQILSIEDPKSVSGPPSTVTQPTGTGPFSFVEWVQGDHLTLKKNAGYFQSGLPYLDGLQFQIFADPQSMVTQFEAGALDVAIQPSLQDTVRLQQDPKTQVLFNKRSGLYLGMAFNTTQPPLDNKLVRQALNYSLDRQRMVQTVWLNLEQPLALLWYPSAPAYDAAKNQTYAFNLDKAKALLQQAGVSDVAIDFNYASTAPDVAQAGQIWQADLEKIGVKLTLKPTEPVALNSVMAGVKYQGVALGSGFYGQLHGGVVWTSPYFGPVGNRSGYKDDKFTQLSLAVYTEVDPAKQKQAEAAWNDYVLDSAHVTAIATQSPRTLAKPNVHGLAYSVGGNYLDVTGAWLAA